MYGIKFKSICYVTHVILDPFQEIRAVSHGDGLLRQVLSPETVLNVV